MYLSKLSLDPASRRVQSELANRYEFHRTLTAQFPGEQRNDIGLLYRVELPDQRTYQPITLLIQTQLEPVWDNLFASAILTAHPQVKKFTPVFSAGEPYFFRLLGNPTMRKKQPDGKSKRVGLYLPEQQQDWLLRKAAQGGFQLRAVQTTVLGMVESIKRKNNREYRIQHLGVQFDGALQVLDPQKFHQSLTHGIGSAKAFGFGLLSLAK